MELSYSVPYLNSGNNHSHLIAGKSVFFQPSFYFFFLLLFGNNPFIIFWSSGFCSLYLSHILIFFSICQFYQTMLWRYVFYVLQLPSSLTLSLPYPYFCFSWQHYKKLVSFTTSVSSDVEEESFAYNRILKTSKPQWGMLTVIAKVTF